MSAEPQISHETEKDTGSVSFEIMEGAFESGVFVLCDHASNWMPDEYGSLGLPNEQLERHIGYDIGAAAVSAHIARTLNAPAIFSKFSRLLIDPNRDTDDPTLVMRLSDGAVVPGNAHVTPEEVQHRIDTYYSPYHEAVDDLIDRAIAFGKPPVLISIHSFTPVWKDIERPWQAAILWDQDPRMAVPLLNAIRTETDLMVGDNEPYTGFLKGDCMYKHGTKRGLAHALIEVRQDLIATPEGQAEWGERLSTHIQNVISDPEALKELFQIKHYGSRSDK